VATRSVKNPVTAVKSVEKRFVDEALVKFASLAKKLVLVLLNELSDVIVVVAKVVVPTTNKVPLADKLPCESAKKPKFSTQFEPSQRSVELVAEPTKTAPKTVFQYVDVPVLNKT
jgi:hypothetical protein